MTPPGCPGLILALATVRVIKIQVPRGECKYSERVGVSGRPGYRWKALGELSRSYNLSAEVTAYRCGSISYGHLSRQVPEAI